MTKKRGKKIANNPHIPAIDQAISAGTTSDSQIAKRFKVSSGAISNYRRKEYPKHIANAVVSDRDRHSLDTLVMRLDAGISKIEKITDACDEHLTRADGSYDLSSPKKAAPYVKMLIEAVRVLSPSIKDMASVMGALKERAEVENNPVVILAQIGQVIQGAGSREEIIDGLKRLKQDNDKRD